MASSSCAIDDGANMCSPSSSLASHTLFSKAILVLCLAPLAYMVLPFLWKAIGFAFGWRLQQRSAHRRREIVELTRSEENKYFEERKNSSNPSKTEDGKDGDWEKVDTFNLGTSKNGAPSEDEDWDGIIGFFHPFCNAGGGGERVLWAAIRATQQRWPRATCVVYTGDHGVTKDAILSRVSSRFNIQLHPPTIHFLYLTTRHWVLASTWPRFTLAGQSLGSIIMAWDAFSLLVPDIFIDTMGYAFALGLAKFLFGKSVPTAAYVHYPTISTDMLDSLDPSSAVGDKGLNAGQGVGLRGALKKRYWRLFAAAYSLVGASADVVMTNSSWTQNHIQQLWGPRRQSSQPPIAVVYPPVAVSELLREVDVSPASDQRREKMLLYIAQFRPEKNHQLILQAFAEFVKSSEYTKAADGARLVLVGSVRGDADSKRVYQLRLLANELHIKDRVEFRLDAPWKDVLDLLRRASVGVNAMWNEHFGIGVVEYQASGLVAVVHDSGGPKMDIVVDIEGNPTGFHATTASEFAAAFDKALTLPDPLAVRLRARRSAQRFTEEEFARRWIEQTEGLFKAKSVRVRKTH